MKQDLLQGMPPEVMARGVLFSPEAAGAGKTLLQAEAPGGPEGSRYKDYYGGCPRCVPVGVLSNLPIIPQ